MRFTRMQKVDELTWIHIEGSAEEIAKAEQWVKTSATMWVMDYPVVTKAFLPDGSPASGNMTSFILSMIKQGKKSSVVSNMTIIHEKKFCFKDPGDALRFKLSM